MDTSTALTGGHKVISRLRKEIPRLSRSAGMLLIIGPAGVGKAHLAKLLHITSGRTALTVLHPHLADTDIITDSFTRLRGTPATIIIRDIEEFSYIQQSALGREFRSIDQRSSPSKVIVTSKIEPPHREVRPSISEELSGFLNTLEAVRIPALDERREDIPLLVEEFIREACESAHVPVKTMDTNSLDFLMKQQWEGNVRQLRSLIEQLVLRTPDSVITLPREMSDEFLQLKGILSQIAGKKRFSFDDSLGYLERTLIERTLEVADYNQVRAAQILNLSEANFRYRLKKFSIPQSRRRR